MCDDLSHSRLDVPNMGDSNGDGESAIFDAGSSGLSFTFQKFLRDKKPKQIKTEGS